MVNDSLALWAPFSSAWENRALIYRLAKREFDSRYRGSVLGIFWAFFVPLLLVGVYTFIFSMVFTVRWALPVGGKGAFALILFSGLILFNFFSECVNRAPVLLLEHVTYIKKVVFPLEILPWVSLIVALFHTVISFLVLLFIYFFVYGLPPATVFLLPAVVCPLILLTLGTVWFVSSVGIYIRDIRPFIGVVTTIMMFLSPIFYPLEAVPEAYRTIINLNPLTCVLESTKKVLFWGDIPHWSYWVLYMTFCLACSWLGFVWFQKTRRGFADVV